VSFVVSRFFFTPLSSLKVCGEMGGRVPFRRTV